MQEIDPGIYRHIPVDFLHSIDLLGPSEDTGPPTEVETPEATPMDHRVDRLVDLIPVLMTSTAYSHMMEYLTSGVPELGGMLVGPKAHEIVTDFIPDENARTTHSSYTPNVTWLNAALRRFGACGLDCKGIAHSHPSGCTTPSSGDLTHVRSTFARSRNSGADRFFLPIACNGLLYPYVVLRAEPNEVQFAKLIIV